MSVKNTDVITAEHIHLIDELQDSLEQQIKLIQKGDPGGRKIEELSIQTDVLVEKIAHAGIRESAQFISKRKQLRMLYDKLYMAVSTQKAEIAKQLGHIYKGKKTIATYRKNI